jgi:hypothetical protein
MNYYDIDALSNSSLSVLAKSPQSFHAQYVAKTMKGEETEAMALGSAVHMLALEPHRFEQEYDIHEGPINPKTGKCYGRDTKAFEEWLATIDPTSKWIMRDEFDEVKKIATAFQSHATIADLMGHDCDFERPYSMTWRHDDGWTTSLKCKPDCVIVGESVILDLKTTQDASPSKWQWSALDYGYHRQAAIYLDTLEAMYSKPFRFLFGVVSKNEPYEVAVYKLTEEDLDRGRDEYHALIAEYRQRVEEDNWLASWQVGEVELCLPFKRR